MVAAWGPVPNASAFARDDLTLLGSRDEDYYRFEAEDFDYELVCHLGLQDEKYFPEMEVIWEIERDGATMGVLEAANGSPGQ